MKIDELVQQFQGRKFAELILEHVNHSDVDFCMSALAGLMDELPKDLATHVTELIDFWVAMPQSQQRQYFAGDCGAIFIKHINIMQGFMDKRGIVLTEEQAFTIFNIIVQNYVYACHQNAGTKTAMKKAAGVSLLGRIFGA